MGMFLLSCALILSAWFVKLFLCGLTLLAYSIWYLSLQLNQKRFDSHWWWPSSTHILFPFLMKNLIVTNDVHTNHFHSFENPMLYCILSSIPIIELCTEPYIWSLKREFFRQLKMDMHNSTMRIIIKFNRNVYIAMPVVNIFFNRLSISS
jgi:hypothetical protein